MNPFDNSAFVGFCGCSVQGFSPAIKYSLKGNKLTVSDESAFPSGDAFKNANIWAIDKDGNEVTGSITTAGGNVDLDLSENFDINGGFTVTATVVSESRQIADLSVRGVGWALAASSGELDNIYIQN